MTNSTCYNGSADRGYPAADLTLDVTFFSEITDALRFRLHRSPLPVGTLSLVAMLGICVPLMLAAADSIWIVGLLIGAAISALWALVSMNGIHHRPASPSYVMAALRSLTPDRRQTALEVLNTVSLRGQHIPFSQAEVVAAVRDASSQRLERGRAIDERKRRAAHVQACLIDAFRG
jgi:hypothetical protein